MYINTNGVITPRTAGSPTTTNTVVGVCVGVRYVSPDTKQSLFAQYLPSGAITAGYTDVWIRVNDDPDQLYSIQADTVIGTRVNGARGAIGGNAALKTFTGSASTGLSQTVLDTGANWGSVTDTSTLAMRVIDIITPDDIYPEVLVKFNQGVHQYYNSTGVAV
jgi:hypothetical protein